MKWNACAHRSSASFRSLFAFAQEQALKRGSLANLAGAHARALCLYLSDAQPAAATSDQKGALHASG
jgi:hypothetical protein